MTTSINLNLPETPRDLQEPVYTRILEIYNALHILERELAPTGSIGGSVGSPGPSGPPGSSGPAGEDGANGMTPYFLSSSEIFSVPVYKQCLFEMMIDNEGTLDVEGYLVEVD